MTSLALLTGASALHAQTDDIVELDTVSVDAEQEDKQSISTQKLLKVPGAGDDPVRALTSLPGIVQGQGYTAAPAVRGASPRDNRYFIDFMPVGGIFHSDTSSIINANTIENFDIEAAAFPAPYYNANGAVLNMNSRSPYTDQKQAVIDLSPIKASVLLEAPLARNHSAYFSARKSLFQYYLKNVVKPDGLKFTTFPQYDDYQGKYEYRPNATDRITLNLLGATDEVGILFDGSSAAAKQNPGIIGQFGVDRGFHSQAVLWEKQYESGSSHKLGFSHLNQIFHLQIGGGNKIDVDVHSYHIRSQLTQPINLDHTLDIGLHYSLSKTSFYGKLNLPPTDEFSPDPPIVKGGTFIESKDHLSTSQVSAFIQDTWDITPTTSLIAGMNASYDDLTQQSFAEPRLKTVWRFMDDWSVYAATGRHHQLSTQGGNYSKDFGNPELKQPTSDHYLVGIDQTINNNFNWSLELYYKNMADIVVARPEEDAFDQLPRYLNKAKGHAWGAEFLFNKALTNDWYGWVSLAYSHTERTNELTDESFLYEYDKPWVVNVVGAYQFSKTLQLGFRWHLESGQLYTPVNGAVPVNESGQTLYYRPIYGGINSKRLPVNHSLNVRLDKTYLFNNWKLDAYIEVLNAYNRNNVSGYEYTDEKYQERKEVASLPIIGIFGLKFSL